MADMFALPPQLQPRVGPHVSGLACPDCSGVLEGEVQSRKGHRGFRCRVGHVYALADLLVAKEQAGEARLWGALVAVEELAALLTDVEARAEDCWPGGEGQCHARRAALAAYAGTPRRLIEADRPLSLDPGSPP